jgi:hypothetical protein
LRTARTGVLQGSAGHIISFAQPVFRQNRNLSEAVQITAGQINHRSKSAKIQ